MDLQAAMAAHAPIFITAPSARNGVTLIQRLLNSTRQMMVFGENTLLVDHLPNGALMAVNDHRRFSQSFEASRRRFTTQTTEYWSSDLWPDSGQFMLVMYKAFKDALDLYARTSQDCGFDRWGIKNPMTNPFMINRIRAILPNARFVIMIRSPFDVIRSAKAREFVKTPGEVGAYAQMWSAHVRSVLESPFDNGLVMPYDAMLQEPDVWLSRLETFTGVSGIDHSVMERKINTFAGYAEPVGLTSEEEALVREHAGEAMAAAGVGGSELEVKVMASALRAARVEDG